MYSAEGNTLKVTRKNAFKGVLKLIYKDGRPYVPEMDDRIVFEVGHKELTPNKKSYAKEGPIITKDIPIDTLRISLSNEDTNIPEGNYVYDVTVHHANGDDDTVIQGKDFIVGKKI